MYSTMTLLQLYTVYLITQFDPFQSFRIICSFKFVILLNSSFPINFSNYSSNVNDIAVTIAGSVCDVASANSTHIICVTNAQGQSQLAKVQVSVGNQGIARMVR